MFVGKDSICDDIYILIIEGVYNPESFSISGTEPGNGLIVWLELHK